MSRFVKNILILSFVFWAYPSIAQETRSIPVSKFDKLFETLDKIPAEDRTLIDMHASVGCEGVDNTDLIYDYVTDTGRKSLFADKPKGLLDISTLQSLPEDAEIEVLNRKDCSFSFTMTPKITLGKSMDAQAVRAALQQLRKAVVKIVPFYARPMIPRSLDLGIALDEGASGEMIYQDGTREPLTYQELKNGFSGVVVSTKSLKKVDRLEFTQTPTRLVDMGRGVGGK